MLFWAKAGHEVAWEQFCLQKGDLASADLINKGALQVKEDDNSLLISGRSFSVQWEKKVNGSMTSLYIRAKKCWLTPMIFRFSLSLKFSVLRQIMTRASETGWLKTEIAWNGSSADKSGIFPP